MYPIDHLEAVQNNWDHKSCVSQLWSSGLEVLSGIKFIQANVTKRFSYYYLL